MNLLEAEHFAAYDTGWDDALLKLLDNVQEEGTSSIPVQTLGEIIYMMMKNVSK